MTEKTVKYNGQTFKVYRHKEKQKIWINSENCTTEYNEEDLEFID